MYKFLKFRVFSPELFLLLFMFSGEFKNLSSSAIFSGYGFLLSMLIMSFASSIFYLKKITLNRGVIISLVSFFLLLSLIYFNYNMLSSGATASTKFIETFALLPVIALMGFLLQNSKGSIKRLMNAILILSGTICFFFLLKFSPNNLKTGVFTDSYQRVGIFSVLGFVASWIFYEEKKENYHKILLLIAGLIFLITLVLSAHRTGILCLLGSIFYLLYIRFKNVSKITLVSMMGLFLVLYYILFLKFNADLIIIRRIESAVYNVEENVRLLMFTKSINEATNNLFFGGGYGMFEQLTGITGYRHPHNFFAEILLELGLLGVLLYMITYFGWLFRRNISSKYRPIIALFIVCVIYSSFSGEISEHRLLLFLSIYLRK